MSFPRFTLRGFRRPREVARLSLGELERRAMDVVWQKQELSVRDLFHELKQKWAYTTLMTTLDRLGHTQSPQRAPGLFLFAAHLPRTA